MIKNSPFKNKRKRGKNNNTSINDTSSQKEDVKAGKQYENFYNLVKRRINSF